MILRPIVGVFGPWIRRKGNRCSAEQASEAEACRHSHFTHGHSLLLLWFDVSFQVIATAPGRKRQGESFRMPVLRNAMARWKRAVA
jgi:hypothetical protein